MNWQTICAISDIPNQTGVAALVAGKPIAIFYVDGELFAVDNFCPLSKTNSLSRGIVGTINGELCVASPLYKQHYALRSGQCLEDAQVTIATYTVRARHDMVELDTNCLAAVAA